MNEDPRDSNQPVADEPKPVAYDSEGRPLYAAPPTVNAASPKSVYFSRAVSPEKPPISDDVKARHDDSVKRYPSLNLSEAEYVISAVERHPIGLVGPIAITVLLVAIIASFLINFSLVVSSLGILSPPPFSAVLLIGVLLILLVLVGGYIAVWIYTSNHFFLTNESVIQEIQTSLFSKHEQTVSLINIEDASYQQQGILQAILNYGSIRLSTEGDETTYRFSYVANPKEQIATLNNAVEAFKNGRPVLND
jgi:hypothetical protein